MIIKVCERLFQSLIRFASGGFSDLKELLPTSALGNSLLLLLILSATVCYLHKRHIMEFFYARCGNNYSGVYVDELDATSKPFDCFIAYGQEDKDVTAAIVRELGDKSPHYRFCTRDRNWALGSYIPTNVFQSVRKSRKTVMIVSGAFVENRWFHLQFQVAFHEVLKFKEHRLILILKDLPDQTCLPRDVQHYLDTRSSLQWGETWFWERLKYSLEDDGVGDKESRGNIQYMIQHLDNKDEAIKELLEDIVI